MLENDKFVSDRMCSVYNREIGCELCYETVQVLEGLLKRSSVPEMDSVIDLDEAKARCEKCIYLQTWE